MINYVVCICRSVPVGSMPISSCIKISNSNLIIIGSWDNSMYAINFKNFEIIFINDLSVIIFYVELHTIWIMAVYHMKFQRTMMPFRAYLSSRTFPFLYQEVGTVVLSKLNVKCKSKNPFD